MAFSTTGKLIFGLMATNFVKGLMSEPPRREEDDFDDEENEPQPRGRVYWRNGRRVHRMTLEDFYND